MQKMWAITAITLVGFMMIISSIPQDAFAVKNTVKLSLIVVDDIGKVKNAVCKATSFNDKDKELTVVTDNTGNSGRVSFTFPDVAVSVDVICGFDGTFDVTGDVNPFTLSGKNTRGTYQF